MKLVEVHHLQPDYSSSWVSSAYITDKKCSMTGKNTSEYVRESHPLQISSCVVDTTGNFLVEMRTK